MIRTTTTGRRSGDSYLASLILMGIGLAGMIVMGMAILLLLAALLTPAARSQERGKVEEPKPAARVRKLDLGWWTRTHALSVLYDGATTELWKRECAGCYEADPIARAIGGRRATSWRMGLAGAGEVIGVAAIPNKKVRRVVQASLIGVHLWAGTHNLRRWH